MKSEFAETMRENKRHVANVRREEQLLGSDAPLNSIVDDRCMWLGLMNLPSASGTISGFSLIDILWRISPARGIDVFLWVTTMRRAGFRLYPTSWPSFFASRFCFSPVLR
jgi:hypothetical protein